MQVLVRECNTPYDSHMTYGLCWRTSHYLSLPAPRRAVQSPRSRSLLSSNQSVSAPLAALLLPLRRLAHKRRAAARVVAATIVLTAILAVSQAEPIQAGPGIAPVVPSSLLPTDLGVGVETNRAVTITFVASMDRASVERGLALIPSEPTRFAWSSDRRALTISAARRWRTDQRYLVVVPAQARTSTGRPLRRAERYSFTTQTAPAITDFAVDLAGVNDRSLAALPKQRPHVRSSPSRRLTPGLS